MKLKFILAMLCVLASNMSYSQTINPDVNTPYCPGQTMTFTVIVPLPVGTRVVSVTGVSITVGTYNTVGPNVLSQATNPTYVQGVSTQFSFTGSFVDNNSPQTFQVICDSAGAGVLKTYNFTYNKIESFLYPYAASMPVPSPLTVSPPRCQVTTLTINFPNVSFVANIPNGAPFGAAKQYEFQIPANWSIGGTVSTGSNWITGSNSVKIITDLSGGDGQYITIRALNPCNASLIPGPPVQVLISRPHANLFITTTDNTNLFCSGSKTFTMNGMLPTATIQWNLINTAIINFSGSTTSPAVTVTAVGGSGEVNLQAVVTDCDGNHIINQLVRVGAPHTVGFGISYYTNATFCYTNNFQILQGGGGYYAYSGQVKMSDDGLASSFTWSNPNPNDPISMYFSDLGGGLVSVSSKTSNGSIGLKMTASNTCGSASQVYYFHTTPCNLTVGALPGSQSNSASSFGDPSRPDENLSISPNPAHDMISIRLPGGTNPAQTEIRINDSYGRLIRKIVPASNTSNIVISDLATGMYFVEIYAGKKRLSVQKILKN
jgi:hypothetical protein